MARNCWLVLVAIASSSIANATTYTVRNNKDSGKFSLRWALTQASNHAGRDKIVFAPTMAGKVIRPLTELPPMDDNRTILNGDINGDGAPDVSLNGSRQAARHGLEVLANRCQIIGLAIVGFPDDGIHTKQSSRTTIRSCHVGVNLAGTRAVHNGGEDVELRESSDNLIGGSNAGDGNVISGGAGNPSVRITDGNDNVVIGNYFGLNRSGAAALGEGWEGVVIMGGARNVVGGSQVGERNVFGGLTTGIAGWNTRDGTIAGNYFGLAADGDTPLPIRSTCIKFRDGSRNNLIGGTDAGARNVFAGGAFHGVSFSNPNTQDNRVQGNYFGTNAGGTKQRRLQEGVVVMFDAGPQTIGGTPKARNYFASKYPTGPRGVVLDSAGSGSVIRNNWFGVRPDGQAAPGLVAGVSCSGVATAKITQNLFSRIDRSAIVSWQAGTNPEIYRNTFRRCTYGVRILDNARARLGSLSNARTRDDGGNIFRSTNTWFIYNETPNRIRAEGNSFGTTSKAAINAKIYDKLDDGTKGKVDFDPLAGGVHPTGTTLALTGATALPTAAGGAEVLFSLSTPANVTVTVLNIAGRPIATIAQDRSSEAGLQRIVWSGRSDHGTRAPAGRYMVRVTARDDSGAQVRSLTTVRLGF